jgi:hypothetical protein
MRKVPNYMKRQENRKREIDEKKIEQAELESICAHLMSSKS